MRLIQPNDNTRMLFEIHILEDGTYAAIRNTEPMFCFVGSDVLSAVNTALKAFESYKTLGKTYE